MSVEIVSPREQIAANVQAELHRKRLNTRALPGRLGKSYAYWQRRTSGIVAFDVDELFALAGLLDVNVTAFFAGVQAFDSDDHLRAWRDSNPQPSEQSFDALRNLIDLESYRTRDDDLAAA